jgi:hypothetical protein
MKKVSPSIVVAVRFAAVVVLLVAAQPANAFSIDDLNTQLAKIKTLLDTVSGFKEAILTVLMLIIAIWGGTQYNKGEGGGPAWGKMGGALGVLAFLAIVWGVM